MITRICDRCGHPLETGALRYTAKIQVFAAYDPLDITSRTPCPSPERYDDIQ